ncbi:uncharacterized protein PV07_08003 [Cladophialophora immunda]|uniref:Uncharacterized protein n=1 Tax=Cladophialophora immunda TaxID=569365 RepID=A0A0D2CDG1_9EURO|nr:uncharacterized protein PV07_08003 [Cladophialophora immunda]KIW28330.1 hypothetical protein PV07_08003 [Cladophialophora immunda]OQV03434.1 hypothetical protein CLAIMM_08480 [Cladophialophora immunda]
MPSYRAALVFLAALTPFAYVHADSSVFSQFFGATTASPPSATDSLYLYTICTNAIHGLPALTGLPLSESIQLEQVAVDAVCAGCTSLGQSRIDSCCAQATSSACFDQFAAANAAQTTPASASATPTALTGDSGTTASSSSNGGIVLQNTDLIAGSFIGAVVGFVGWLL